MKIDGEISQLQAGDVLIFEPQGNGNCEISCSRNGYRLHFGLNSSGRVLRLLSGKTPDRLDIADLASLMAECAGLQAKYRSDVVSKTSFDLVSLEY